VSGDANVVGLFCIVGVAVVIWVVFWWGPRQ
jgi:hypothetical protein